MDGKLGTISYNDQRARGSGNWPAIRAMKLKANQGELPVGLLLAEDASGEGVPFEQLAGEVLGTGDGETLAFSATLAKAPIHPGSLVVTDGVEAFRDDGYGRLVGDAGGSGTVDYETGDVSVSFGVNVVNETDVVASYDRKLAAVLDELADTTKTGSALAVRMGPVVTDVLKVGAVAQVAPSAAVLKKLERMGIFPV